MLKRDRVEKPYVKKDGSVSSRPRVFFSCHVCKQLFKRDEVVIDHLEPVGPTPGSKLAPPGWTWNDFIPRLFCPASNLACICYPCHSAKTKADNARLRESARGPMEGPGRDGEAGAAPAAGSPGVDPGAT